MRSIETFNLSFYFTQFITELAGYPRMIRADTISFPNAKRLVGVQFATSRVLHTVETPLAICLCVGVQDKFISVSQSARIVCSHLYDPETSPPTVVWVDRQSTLVPLVSGGIYLGPRTPVSLYTSGPYPAIDDAGVIGLVSLQLLPEN